MLKRFAALLFFAASAAAAQTWVPLPDAWVRLDGGPTVAAGVSTLQEEGGNVSSPSVLNCVGAGITCSDVAGVGTLTVPGAAAAGYQTVKDEGGASLAQETVLDCVGAGIVCSAGAGKTVITVGAAAGAVALQGAYPGTPDTGNANITGTYGSTQNNVHATISNFGLSLENNQAALVGQTKEYTPGIRFIGTAWDTDGAVSNTNAWQIFGRPLNGNTTQIDLAFYASVAGGAYAQKAYLDSDGVISLGEAGVSAGGVRLVNTTSGQITISPATGALGTKVLTAPAVTDTLAVIGTANAWGDGVKQTFNPDATNAGINVGSVAGSPSAAAAGDLWYDSTQRSTRVGMYGGAGYAAAPGPSFLSIWDDYICGTGGSAATYSCTNTIHLLTGGTVNTVSAAAATNPDDLTRIGVVQCLVNITADVCSWGGSQLTATQLKDGMRWRFAVAIDKVVGDATNKAEFTAGGSDASRTASGLSTTVGGAGAPTEGVWVSGYIDSAVSNNWRINTTDNGASAITTADCGVTIAADTMYDWDIWYESGVGVHFIVDGTECANSPINTTLPTTVTDTFSPLFWKMDSIARNGVAGDISSYVDYFGFSVPLNRQ